ncbi:hypothetical protein V2J09_012544 [Rumex salicifolius]
MNRGLGRFQFTKEPFVEDTEPRKLESIKFSLQSESDILKAGEVDVWRANYYDGLRKPIANGLLDPKMGPANKHGVCATCYAKFDDCPGHFGCLTLALPVFNIGYFGAILEILKCICKSCSRVLLDEKICSEYLKKMRNPKFDSLKKTELKKKLVQKCSGSAKAIKCWRCGYQNGKVKKDKSLLTIIHDRPRMADGEEKSSNSVNLPSPLNPVHVLSLFQRMQDQDCELLYLYDRPEKLLLRNIPVPPMALRPSVLVDGGMLSNENDITERLKQIIRDNGCLRHELQETSNKHGCTLQWETLQNAVALYINSEAHVAPSFQQDSSRPLSGFVQRLKGKQGRFRGNLSGKRVQYTGRTVISPDPNLKITEVGIPIHMALILTYPERVTCHNIEKLRQCVRNGPKKYPGAKFITEPNGTFRDLSFAGRKRVADELKFGYIVHRHLEDGDVVLFNRQPSLHRMSIMCHRVQNNLCTPKNGVVLVASTQDFLTTSFLITRKDTFYDRANFSLMCSYMGDAMDHIDLPTPAVIKPIELWTGKQLFNVLLRPNTGMRVYVNLMVREKNYSKPDDRESNCREETMCPNDGFVYFRNSELICGQLGKATLGNGNKIGLYSVLLHDYNEHAASACMNRLAKLSARWIGNHGFSIGIDDVQPGTQLNDRKGKMIDQGYVECDGLIGSFNAGKLTLMPGCNAAQTLEAKITKTLNEIRDTTSKVCMKELHWRNSPLIMSQCGSKGSPINISQMVACVGQQAVGGKRAPDGFIDRSLPHFPGKSKTPAAKGFVANSFYTGLTATEFFFHTMGGREGLVDTAVKTADTGYMSRRLMKALEDLAVYYDMTVRNPSGTIIQFLYGDDGMDPAQMEGAEGFPLDFGRLLEKSRATCPDGQSSSLSLDEVKEILPKDFIDSDGPWSLAFKKQSEFIESAVGKKRLPLTQKQLKMSLLEFPVSKKSLMRAKKLAHPSLQQSLRMMTTWRLLKVAKSIKLEMTSIKAYISVKLDMEKIRALRLNINAENIQEKISRFLKTRPKDIKQLTVKNMDINKLNIIPDIEKDKLHFGLHWLKNRLPMALVKGISTVERAIIAEEEGKKGKHQLIVEGTGLLEVMGMEGLKGCYTESNHVMEVYRTLGIEAARTCIIKEIKKVMQSHSMEIDIRHMMLLADIMTFKGEVLAITRVGISKMKDSVLMLASFEKTAEHLFNASVIGKDEKIVGVSESIIMGVPMQVGTGMLKVIQRAHDVRALHRLPDAIIS